MKPIGIFKLAIIALFSWLLNSNTVLAAKWAVVTSEKAIIYSDLQMESSLGFVKKGTRVRIGNVKKNKGMLYSTVVNGRIAYIKVEDFDKRTKKLSAFEVAAKRYKLRNESASEISRLGIFGGVSGGSFTHPEEFFGEKNYTLTSKNYGLKGSYINQSKSRYYRASLSGSIASVDDQTLTFYSVAADKMWLFIESKYFSLHPFVGLTISPYAEYKYSDLFTVSGYALGGQLGLEFRIGLFSNLSLHFEGGGQYLQFMGFEVTENPNSATTLEPTYINGYGAITLSTLI